MNAISSFTNSVDKEIGAFDISNSVPETVYSNPYTR